MTFAVSEGKAYGVDHTIAELEQKLDPQVFVRIHRKTLVNWPASGSCHCFPAADSMRG